MQDSNIKNMHQQQRKLKTADRHQLVKWQTTYMPSGNGMPFSKISNDKKITRLCTTRTSE